MLTEGSGVLLLAIEDNGRDRLPAIDGSSVWRKFLDGYPMVSTQGQATHRSQHWFQRLMLRFESRLARSWLAQPPRLLGWSSCPLC